MVSVARNNFLESLSAFDLALDNPAVVAGDKTGEFFRRGLTVAAFNLLETFIENRLTELTAKINNSYLQFSDLPEKLQRRAITNSLTVGNTRVRRLSRELPELLDFANSLGSSISAVQGTLNISPFTWLWSESNLRASALASALKLLHVDKPWENLRELAARLSFNVAPNAGSPIDLSTDFDSLLEERHQCAHVATHNVTTIWIRSVPERILRCAITFDAFASISANLLQTANTQYLSDPSWVDASKISIRFIRERTHDFAEFKEHGVRALRKGPDGQYLFDDARSRCAPNEMLVWQSNTNSILRWAIPISDA